MKRTVKNLSELVHGNLEGDASKVVTGAAGLAEATPNDISFVKSLKDSNILKLLAETKAGAVLVPSGIEKKFKPNSATLIEVKNPLAAFSEILALISAEKNVPPNQVHPLSFVSPQAKLGKNISIGPFCVIEAGAEIGDHVWLHAQVYVGARSKVGDGTVLYPHVVLREEVQVGKNCILHPGCVVGADGYGFFFKDGKHNKIPQIGTVIIEDDVEIGSCSTIDRATTGATIIRKGTKLDNLVQVAHNVDIGEHSLLAAQVGIAGSTKVGKGVVLGGQAGVADHVTIADRTQLGAKGGITTDTAPGSVLWGTPAQPLLDELKMLAYTRRLPDLFKDVKKLKEQQKENV